MKLSRVGVFLSFVGSVLFQMSSSWAGHVTLVPEFSLHSKECELDKESVAREIDCQTNFSRWVEFSFTLGKNVKISNVRFSGHDLIFNLAILGSCKNFDTATARAQSKFEVKDCGNFSFNFNSDCPVFMDGQQYCIQRQNTIKIPVPDFLQGLAWIQEGSQEDSDDQQQLAIQLESTSIDSWFSQIQSALMDQLIRSEVSVMKDLDYQKIFNQLRGGGSQQAVSESLAELAIDLQDHQDKILSLLKDSLHHPMTMTVKRGEAEEKKLSKFQNGVPVTLEKLESGINPGLKARVKLRWSDDSQGVSPSSPSALLMDQDLVRTSEVSREKELSEEELTEGLSYAVREDRFQDVSEWLSKGANPHGTLRSGSTPFNEAIRNDRRKILRLFFRQGINVNQSLMYGYTALMAAILNEKPELAAELRLNGARTNLANSDGDTAQSLNPEQFAKAEELFRKARLRRIQIVSELLANAQSGSKISLRNSNDLETIPEEIESYLSEKPIE